MVEGAESKFVNFQLYGRNPHHGRVALHIAGRFQSVVIGGIIEVHHAGFGSLKIAGAIDAKEVENKGLARIELGYTVTVFANGVAVCRRSVE